MADEQRVKVWRERASIPTYEPLAPDRNPMFLEKRVYQGSSGRVYPLPFYDRISTERKAKAWDAVYLENEYLQVMILPEIGGRIHAVKDKTNGYDLIYRQEVIKPALVGLAGPWISGGIEFNWPQHHRPGTFMPADVEIEEEADGSVTVWLSEHDPMNRLKGMHGVCLRPERAYLELRVRLYNRTPMVQSFLWWANVATKVHEYYQSFFPPDVFYVADHAKRATSRYPLCEGRYYGVDYGERGRNGVPEGEMPRQFVPPAGEYAANDLSWYANIPVPTSYMCMGTKQDFFGGYDHAARAGIVHYANHHISPGKKQWTWGNHEFGYAWDRNLTDADEAGVYHPYIELMAGVFTDNQPDFSFLMPGETRTFSQYWYPIQKIGPAQQANLDAAVSLRSVGRMAEVGVAVSRRIEGATVRLLGRGRRIWELKRTLEPGDPLVEEVELVESFRPTDLRLEVREGGGREVIAYQPVALEEREVPAAATEPAAPDEVETADELYITGLHLEQYRHATRMPEAYWREALRRDPLDSRCNNAMGRWHLRRGEFVEAEEHFRWAIDRLTSRNPNPYDGEPYYNLGLALRCVGQDEEAYEAFYKATWNQAWQGAGFLALAEIDCEREEWSRALEHLEKVLRVDAESLKARDLKAIVLRKLGKAAEAEELVAETLRLDPLDFWAQHLAGRKLTCDTQVRLDIALDLARAGLYREALEVLAEARPEALSGTAPLVEYYRAYLCTKVGDAAGARQHLEAAAKAPADYCFPARLEEIGILRAAMEANPADARAPYYLGNLMYDRRRHRDAIALWQRAVKLDPMFATAWRNLGIGAFNVLHDAGKAKAAYERAFAAGRGDARVLYERDQLWKRIGVSPEKRLAELRRYRELVASRDDLSVELCALYNLTGQHEKALEILRGRHFQPWEGGEGLALGQHVTTHLALGRKALEAGDAAGARRHFEAALESPENLGEAKHLLANQSNIHYWLGEALAALGGKGGAREHWTIAAEFTGDFQEMSVRAFSEMTYYSALSLQRLGKKKQAEKLLRDLLEHAEELEQTPAKIDYFATSLPTMLLFEDDLQKRQTVAAVLMQAQALLGLGQAAVARKMLERVRKLDPNNAMAAGLLSQTKPVKARRQPAKVG